MSLADDYAQVEKALQKLDEAGYTDRESVVFVEENIEAVKRLVEYVHEKHEDEGCL